MDNDGSLIGHQKIWREDKEDGKFFYDFLQPYFVMPGIEVDSSCIDNILAPYRNLISKGLEKYKDNRDIFEKYEWGANYFNSVLSEYPQSSLETIRYSRSSWKSQIALPCNRQKRYPAGITERRLRSYVTEADHIA